MNRFSRYRGTSLRVILTYGFLIIWSLICLTPLLLLVGASFRPAAIFVSIARLVSPRNLTASNYVRALGQGGFMHFLRNSLFIATTATGLVLIICLPMAYGMVKLSRRWNRILTLFLLSMRFIPFVVLALPMYLFFLTFGITGTRLGIVVAHLSLQIPFVGWLLIGFFQDVPTEIEEAAIVDGCGPLRVFWSISLPIIRPGISASAILCFIISWNEYLFALFLGGYDAQPLTVGLTRFMGGIEGGAQYGVIAAYSTLTVLPVVVFAFVVNRFIVSGLTAGAVKG